MNYELAYRIGFHPWEDAEAHSPFVEKISELLAEEESGREPPYGMPAGSRRSQVTGRHSRAR